MLYSDNVISDNILSVIRKEINMNKNKTTVEEKKKRANLKQLKLVKTTIPNIPTSLRSLITERGEKDERKRGLGVAKFGT